MIINNISSLNSSRIFSNQILLTTSTATDLNLNDFTKEDNNYNYNDDEIYDINIYQEDIINISDGLKLNNHNNNNRINKFSKYWNIKIISDMLLTLNDLLIFVKVTIKL